MARSSLWRGLAFALLAGTTLPLFVWQLPYSYGYGLLLAVIVHVAVVASSLRDALRASVLAAFLAAPCALFIRDQLLISALAVVILGLVRGAVLYPRPFLRALLLELVVSGLAILVALIWLGDGAFAMALSGWSFWLVQSGFSLTVTSAKTSPELPLDAFERAQQLAEAVLAGRPR